MSHHIPISPAKSWAVYGADVTVSLLAVKGSNFGSFVDRFEVSTDSLLCDLNMLKESNQSPCDMESDHSPNHF